MLLHICCISLKQKCIILLITFEISSLFLVSSNTLFFSVSMCLMKRYADKLDIAYKTHDEILVICKQN